MRATFHPHSVADECTAVCPAFNPDAWRCSNCNRQRPMMADTEDWPRQLCDECFTVSLLRAFQRAAEQ